MAANERLSRLTEHLKGEEISGRYEEDAKDNSWPPVIIGAAVLDIRVRYCWTFLPCCLSDECKCAIYAWSCRSCKIWLWHANKKLQIFSKVCHKLCMNIMICNWCWTVVKVKAIWTVMSSFYWCLIPLFYSCEVEGNCLGPILGNQIYTSR